MRKKEKLFLSLLIIFAILLLVQIMGNNKVLANTVIEINNTNFPDSNFVSRLKEIFPSYTKDNLLTSDEIDKITSINLSMRGIKDLTGIEHFTALTFLNLEVNNLVTLDLSKNNNLTTLEISNNQQLTSLKLPQSIENVYMNFNTKLTNFDISHYPNLKLFYGADVPLKQVEISNLTELIALDLENTGIQSINVTNQIKLEYLNVSFNQLGELDISKNKNLVTLRTNNNKLTKLCLPNTKQNNTTLEYYQQQIKDGYEIKWYNGNELIKENETIAMKGQVLTATISPKTYQIAIMQMVEAEIWSLN